MLAGKKILLGISGGIAIYKILDLCSRLKKKGVDLEIIMTEGAKEFIRPLTFETMGQCKVYSEMFHKGSHEKVEHIELTKDIDAFLVAPATANILAKARMGLADDLLSATILASEKGILFAPTMNTNMYHHPATQENMTILKERGHSFLEPGSGLLACGDQGEGRMMEPEDMVVWIEHYFTEKDLKGKKLLITAGPTRERIDPVRYISNDSSGKMGIYLAEEARKRGAEVLLLTGPGTVKTKCPEIKFETTKDLKEKVKKYFKEVDALIMAAAPGDYCVQGQFTEKIKSTGKNLILELRENPDILKSLKKRKNQIVIGFAAESHNLLENAREKLEEKNLDYILANNISKEDTGFYSEDNEGYLISKNNQIKISKRSKREMAHMILDVLLD